MTHTFAELEVSEKVYDEVAAKLKEAGYDHAFMEEGAIDMHGIGLVKAATKAPAVVSVVINGMSCDMTVPSDGKISYHDIVAIEYGAELEKVRVLSCTWRSKNGNCGILLPKESLQAEDGLIINLAHTGNS